MKRLTFCLLVCVFLVALQVASAHFVVFAQSQSDEDSSSIVSIPPCKLDFRTLVEFLADYSVDHQTTIAADTYWGMTSYENRKVYINNTPDYTIRKMIVIHEFCHVFYHSKGLTEVVPKEILEHTIRAQVPGIYREIWGN